MLTSQERIHPEPLLQRRAADFFPEGDRIHVGQQFLNSKPEISVRVACFLVSGCQYLHPPTNYNHQIENLTARGFESHLKTETWCNGANITLNPAG